MPICAWACVFTLCYCASFVCCTHGSSSPDTLPHFHRGCLCWSNCGVVDGLLFCLSHSLKMIHSSTSADLSQACRERKWPSAVACTVERCFSKQPKSSWIKYSFAQLQTLTVVILSHTDLWNNIKWYKNGYTSSLSSCSLQLYTFIKKCKLWRIRRAT